jgi:SlyX protein
MSEHYEQRITELEIRLTHQEDVIDTLSATLISQHEEIEALRLKLELLEKRIKTGMESQVADQKDETPPPHY